MKKFAIIGLLIIAALTSCSNNETADNSFRAEQYRDELRMHDSQVEWWYFFAFAEGKTTGREYGIMASFFTFRGGENSPVGHYAIHEVTDLQTGAHYATSRADSAFLTTMGNVEEMIYQFLLQRRPSPIEQMRIDSLKNARAPWPHSRISSITTTEWPVYLDYAGDYFRVNSPELSFDCRAAADDYSFDINLNPVADIVPVMGTGMVSDVMHYYTFPDLALSGRVEFEGAVEDIEGRAWFDHQWQDFGGDPAEIANGWRWAGVQAGDVYIHLYQFHNIFTKELTGSGMMTISRNGAEDILRDVEYRELSQWISPATGVKYPIASRWESPTAGVIIELAPMADSQEMHTLTPLNPSIWEGACEAIVIIDGDTLSGRAFQELNGFADIK